MQKSIKEYITEFKNLPEITDVIYRRAQAMYISGNCQVLSQSARGFDVLVFDEDSGEVQKQKL